MAVYPNMLVTQKGFDLVSRSNATKKAIVYTRIALGDGDLGSRNPTSLTNLISTRLSNLELSNNIDHGNGHYELEAIVDNSSLNAGFWAKEMGVFAKIEGDSTDVLYAYCNGGNLVPYVNDKTRPDIQLAQVDFIVGNAANITASINPNTFITNARLITHNSDPDAHTTSLTDTRTPVIALTATQKKLWARVEWVERYVNEQTKNTIEVRNYE